MKLQYLAVIFVIIILPISLVLGHYIQTQVETLNMQTNYTTKLNGATYDAIKAFQTNTTSNYYSSISDSKIRDIEASVNAFYNSLTASLNYTKSELQAYVPAIVYTLYDGYYIYGKRYNVYDNASINSDGELTSMNIDTTLTDSSKYEYGLKPFVYYSCRYKDENNDFVVNFTLDNFISIYGTVNVLQKDGIRKKQYVTKSGYLINISDKFYEVKKDSDGDVTKVIYKGAEIEKDEVLKEYLKFKAPTSSSQITLPDGEYSYVIYQNQKIYINKDSSGNITNYFWYDKGTAKVVKDNKIIMEIGNGYTNSAKDYYKDAWIFSKWVNDNISGIIQKNGNIVDGDKLEFNAGESKIFEMEKQDPEDPASTFNQHRIAVIKNSIETNLIAAINSYNGNDTSYAYALPKLLEEEWEKVVNNVCIISFMQGIPIGGKYFNNYVVIPNDKNNEFVDTDSVYLLTSNGEYHMANCSRLVEDENYQNQIIGGYVNTSFLSQTLNNNYYYKHVKNGNANQPYTACYNCIVNASGKYDLENIINGDSQSSRNSLNEYDARGNKLSTHNITVLRKKYLTILSREKYNLYKINNEAN